MKSGHQAGWSKLTVNVGFATADEVADSTTDDTEDEASVATDLTSSTTSARAAPAANAATAIEAKRIVMVVQEALLYAKASAITTRSAMQLLLGVGRKR